MPYVTCNEADIYFEDRGDGSPIVFLHGALASCRYFDAQLTALSDANRTVALDFRGHGRSEKSELGHTIAHYARDLHRFLERRELDDVVLIGWSMGALVSWSYMDQFGSDRITGLVNIDMEASRFQWDDYEYGLTDLQGIKDTLALIQQDRSTFIERITEQVFKESPDADIRRLQVDELSRPPASVKSAILFDATTSDYRDVLPDIDVPMLVCAGAGEERGTVASVRNVADLVPDSRFELFEDSDHCPHLEEPDRFNRVLRRFVESEQ